MSQQSATITRCRPRRRVWTFRVLAVVLGVSPFLLLEAGLWVAAWQPACPVGDPFVDFQTKRPLFVPADNGRMVTATDRLEYFRPESFAAPKPADEFRIVCLGGSTVQGRPYQIETSFTSWLELSLWAVEPARRWEVINCGGVSYASYRLVPILEEMLRHEPDLVIVYTGHNEFLEDRAYRSIKQAPPLVADAYGTMAQLKSARFLNQLVSPRRRAAKPPDKEILATEVDALLDYQGGLAQYRRDPERNAAIAMHFEFNLRRMIGLARQAKVPLILVDPPVNLRDCPPFKSEPAADLTAEQAATVAKLLAEAQYDRTTPERELDALKQAAAIDPQNAAIQFRLATHYDWLGRTDEALASYQRANDEDICPLRILSSMNEAIRRVARETQSPLVDVRQKFQSESPGGIPGDNLFVDHVHPTINGHQMIAAEILVCLVELDIVDMQPGWEQRKSHSYQEHWNSLDMVYFERGRQRLEGLRRWTQGRAKKLRTGQGSSAFEAIALPVASQWQIQQWRRHADLEQPIAQFHTVFWDSQDSDTLRPLLKRELQTPNLSVLEIGTGTGFLALYCLRHGAERVVATDINPAAAANARYNAANMGFHDRLEVRQVPLENPQAFGVVGPSERFDLIVSNPPWENREPAAIQEFALYDPDFALLHSLIEGLAQHLTPRGKALLAYGNLQAIETVERLAGERGLTARVLDDRDLTTLPSAFVPAAVVELTHGQ